MLSRTADHLYWMARYMERAENLARILETNHRMSMLPRALGNANDDWEAMLQIMGQKERYAAQHGAVTSAAVLEFMIFDPTNPSSLHYCLRSVRENAHAVRGTLTSELWESINATWLEMRDHGRNIMQESGPGAVCEWVKYRSHLSRGVTLGTMLQDEALRFIRLGTFLERSDNTARILDTQFRRLTPNTVLSQPASDYYPWNALLHSVSAYEVYRKVYREQLTPLRVADLLILHAQMPRSLARCMKEVYANLSQVSNRHSAETERRAGALEAELRFGLIEKIVAGGLHAWLIDFLGRTLDLGQRIADDFLLPTH